LSELELTEKAKHIKMLMGAFFGAKNHYPLFGFHFPMNQKQGLKKKCKKLQRNVM